METAGDRGMPVFVGVDTRSDAQATVALDATGRRPGEPAVANDRAGYARLWKAARHRPNPGGNRDANRAPRVVALNRLRRDPRTRRYVARRTAEGESEREAARCLKRCIARETYRAIPMDAAARFTPG